MKRLVKSAVLGGLAAVLLSGATQSFAQQERPSQDQMRQRMMDRYKEQLAVKDEGEWKIIQERIEKVTAARREASTGGGFGMMGFGGRQRGGPGGGGDNAGDGGNRRASGGGGGGGGFRPEPSPEAEALQKAIDSKAPAEEIKQKLAKLRDARKEKEAKLEKAQEDLRKVLSVSQEASAVLAGLLK